MRNFWRIQLWPFVPRKIVVLIQITEKIASDLIEKSNSIHRIIKYLW
ncbi:MAG: hypothetical protein ACJA01_002904 [Saprospiraceae bacterium]|jgi:hypothetical protein